MWEISTNLQLLNFFRSVIFGLIVSLFYDILKGLRQNRLNSLIIVLFLDLLFFLVLTPAMFCFLIATTNGQLRGYILIGTLIGFLIYRHTISKLLFKFYFKFLKYIFKVAVFLKYKINTFIDRTYQIILKIINFISKIIKKTLNSFKKVLKK